MDTKDPNKPVQGIALYGEFVRESATTQVIVTPQGFDEDGKPVHACLIRRTISEHTPRKQWRFAWLDGRVSGAFVSIDKYMAEGATLDSAKETYADALMRNARSLFEQLLRGGWEMPNEPILVEVSRSDMSKIHTTTTPTKLLYRINACRIAKGYPAEAIRTMAPVTV